MDYLAYTIYILLCAAYCVQYTHHYTPHTVSYKQCEIYTMYHTKKMLFFRIYNIQYNMTEAPYT
jgi:hypothetical protein